MVPVGRTPNMSSPGSACQAYASWSTPVWPKAHTLKLRSPEAYIASADADGDDLRRQHHPLKPSRDDTGRRAGTHSQWDGHGAERSPIRASPEDQVLDVLRKQQIAQAWDEDRVEQVRKLLLAAAREDEGGDVQAARGDPSMAHGQPTPQQLSIKKRDDAFKSLFDSEDLVLSIREIKHIIADWSKVDPKVGIRLLNSSHNLLIQEYLLSSTRLCDTCSREFLAHAS
jgi:hypothetical protein